MPANKYLQLDPVQEQIYRYLLKYKRANDGLSPTVREISTKLGMSSTAIHHQLCNLERCGLIKRIGFKSRGIKIIGGQYIPPMWEGQR